MKERKIAIVVYTVLSWGFHGGAEECYFNVYLENLW
jgi:hypothetical protein